jgi:internalin A
LGEGLIVLIRQGTENILNFIADSKEQGEDLIFEARLFILGEAGVGKTTLARKILDVNCKMPDEKEDTTIGVQITTKIFLQQSEHKPEFRMNIWDFGGQEIYHSTHQLFLSNRSLYVIIGNGRQEDDPELYWLPIQKLLAKDSPVLLVVNKRGELRHKIPVNQLKSRFQNLQGDVVLLNLNSDKDTILEFTDSLEYYIRRLPQFQKGEKLPRKWIGIRESLSALNRNFISIIEFNLICDEHGITDKGKQKFILDYLNDIGVILYFNIPYLDKLVILNTAWLTNAIYRVFNHTEQRNINGRFTRKDLDLVWNTDDYLIYKDEILLIMEHFDLCYRLGSTNFEYVVPKLVQVDQPININWKQESVLRIRYEYDVMPKGILQRLIVRKNNLLASNKNVWQYGCLFNYLDAEALVLLESQNKIIISAKGENRSNLFNILCVEIDQINKDYQFSEDLKVNKLVPCICPSCIRQSAPSYYEYDTLERMYANKIMEIRCPNEFHIVKILDLLNIISKSTKESNSISVFISYSKDDKNYLSSLKKHLSPYKNKLNLWEDHKLTAGENWNKTIQDRLYEAEIIIFLVSASVFNTDYIMDVELKIAKERLERKQNVTVIPIIIRECNWEDSDFAMLNALPTKGKPISLFRNKDTAWKQVVSEIVKVIESKTTD